MGNLKENLGLLTLVILVISNTIGSGIFLLPRPLAHYGSISIIAWITTSFGAMFIALTFAQLNINKKQTVYDFCRNNLGDFTGFQASFTYFNSLWVGNAGVALVLLSYLKISFSSFEISSIVWLLFGIIILWIITFINIKGVICTSLLQKIIFIFQLAPLLMIIFVGMPELNWSNFTNDFNISGETNLSAFSSSAMLTLWSFIGIEAAIMLAQKAKYLHNVKKATVVGTIVIAIIYIMSISVIMGIIRPQELMHSETPFYDVAIRIFGPFGGLVTSICIIASCLGALNSAIILQSKIMYSSTGNIFFMPFKILTKKNHYLFASILPSSLSSLLLIILFLSNKHEQVSMIISLATLFALFVYFLIIVSELKFLINIQFIENKSSRLTIALLAFIYVFCMLIAIDKELLYYGIISWLISAFFYIFLKKIKK